jgi:hypothetical protein
MCWPSIDRHFGEANTNDQPKHSQQIPSNDVTEKMGTKVQPTETDSGNQHDYREGNIQPVSPCSDVLQQEVGNKSEERHGNDSVSARKRIEYFIIGTDLNRTLAVKNYFAHSGG